jgi:isopenicillin N synthase-like dioxygenase
MMGAAEASLPIVDIASFPTASPARRELVASLVARALSERGFMYLAGHGIDPALLARAFDAARRLFALPDAVKARLAYTDVAANFGFQGIEVESLDPHSLPDLKEAFTMRNVLGRAGDALRWPDDDFRDCALALYREGLGAALRLLSVLAANLGLPADFFAERHRGENVTLRFLHYPAGLPRRAGSQLGAGAHTDYGSITLLFQDDVGGLELRGAAGQWLLAPPVPGVAVVNTGDLMEHWTNGRFRSTVHRVRPVTGSRDRYSIALFVDPDTDVEVDCFASCVSAARPAAYAPITAGEHIRRKIAATHLPAIANEPPLHPSEHTP